MLENAQPIVQIPLYWAGAAAVISACLLGAVQLIVGHVAGAASAKSAEASTRAAEAAIRNVALNGKLEIAKLRQEWIDKLRDDIAEFHSIMMSEDEWPFSKELDQKICMLGSRIELRLTSDTSSSQDIVSKMYEMYNEPDVEQRRVVDEDFIKLSRVLFQTEWETVKKEIEL